MRVLVTRPPPDAEALASLLAGLGHESVLCPLMQIREEPSGRLETSGVQAALLTSANGARALAVRLASHPELSALPIFAVGAATAAAARAAGFKRVESAEGDAAALAALVAARLAPEAGALLHIAGRRVAGDLAGALARQGFQVRRAALYDAVAAERLPPEGAAALARGEVDAALFYSPRSAATFVKLARAAGAAESCRKVEAICLSQAVAQALGGLAWRRVRVAGRPEQAALLALLADRGE